MCLRRRRIHVSEEEEDPHPSLGHCCLKAAVFYICGCVGVWVCGRGWCGRGAIALCSRTRSKPQTLNSKP
jgi:hypothetical protein